MQTQQNAYSCRKTNSKQNQQKLNFRAQVKMAKVEKPDITFKQVLTY